MVTILERNWPDKDTQFREIERREYFLTISVADQARLTLRFSVVENDRGEFPEKFWLATEQCQLRIWKGLPEEFLNKIWRTAGEFLSTWGFQDKTIAYV